MLTDDGKMRLRNPVLAIAFAAGICAPALAQQPAKPLPDREPTAVDVAKTPVTDLNLDKEEIPQILTNAQVMPYEIEGLAQCSQIIAAVEELDALLGPDIDLPQEARDAISPGRVAKSMVGSFIPFRGIIREVSGANAHDRAVRAAIQAGIARRGFLKGIGESRRCDYPARPATTEVVAAVMADREAQQAAKEAAKGKDKTKMAEDAEVAKK